MSERVVAASQAPLRILCIGDMHAPYTNQPYVFEIMKFSKQWRPNFIVQIGDLYDQYTYSRYTRSLNTLTPLEEDAEGYEYVKSVWASLCRQHPSAQKFQLIGNHCMRMKKRALEKAPELEAAVNSYFNKLFTFPGVRTLKDDRSELVINDVLFIHGYLGNLGDHVRYNRQSTVVGHSHKGGVLYLRHNEKTLFELNCGHVADDSLLPFSYTPQRTTFWTPGFGTIETLQGGQISPRFVPL